jgi:hypothetical protein
MYGMFATYWIGIPINAISSLIMRPHAQDFDDSLFFKNLINKPVLDVNTARVGACQITNQFFVRRRILIRIAANYIEQVLRLVFESR